jgi:hypothetical protein
VDILCTAVAERRLTLAEPDEGVGAALSAALRYLVSRAPQQGHGGSVHVQNRIICASLAPPA